jgi:hypothetical protein
MHQNLERFDGFTYGRSPAMDCLPDVQRLNRILAEHVKAVWLRAEIKQAYAMLADW